MIKRLLTDEELVEFEQNLREAIAWCHFKLAENKTSNVIDLEKDPPLWHPTLELDPQLPEMTALGMEAVPLMKSAMQRIAIERRNLLKKRRISSFKDPIKTARGKLLISFFQDTVWDTAAKVFSANFFDGAERPPWDTGVSVVEEEQAILISWVPFAWFNAVSKALDVTPCNNIRWHDEESVALPLLAQLAQKGLLI